MEITNNRLVDYTFDDTEPVVEPVTLNEVKEYLRIDPGVSYEDNLLTDLITAAREETEKYTGCSLIARNVTAILELVNRHELPYGPVKSVVNEDQYKLIGKDFPRVEGCGRIEITYSAGFDPVPKGLKEAVLAKIASMYENRGDEDRKHDAEQYYERAFKYRRIVCL